MESEELRGLFSEIGDRLDFSAKISERMSDYIETIADDSEKIKNAWTSQSSAMADIQNKMSETADSAKDYTSSIIKQRDYTGEICWRKI